MNLSTPQARSLFLQAIERSPQDRGQFLDEACEGDPVLRETVERLLESHELLGSFHEEHDLAVTVDLEGPQSDHPGEVIGPYKLLQQIGEGGMGVVYLAQQQEPVKRTVALKVIKPGMDTHEVIARFEAERQALALMDHPNIAKVLDAGATKSGRPFFVMELVKGVPITEYCDQHQLAPKERLELFITICQAVQHAHQKGVIHRDIKPTNVLVTQHDDKPVVKVIDFGIAKATSGQLTDKTLFTGFAQLVGTPLYMSPEQASLNGLDVDTRSDIYSLGVLLYELLTGTTPFDKTRLQAAAFEEIRRIIREEEPQKPSTRLSSLGATLPSVSAQRKMEPRKLSQLVRGDLDWIVMKALEKDRSRRYETANGFAADVLHYLADEPVSACPPSAAYRFKKFTRRNRVALAVSSVVMAALILVIGAFGWTLRDRAAREQQTLQERTQRQIKVAKEVELALNEAKQARERALRVTGDPYEWESALAAANSALKSATGIAAQDEQALSPKLRGEIDALKSALRADQQDHQFAARFDAIRLAQSDLNRSLYAFRLDSAYPGIHEALNDAYQIQMGSTSLHQARERIHSRPHAVQQIVWASLEVALANAPSKNKSAQEWLKALLASVDDAPWRQRARKAIDGRDWDAMDTLVRELSQAREPVADLLRLADRAPRYSPQRLAMLEQIRSEYPGDFWANYHFAVSLAEQSPPRLDEAVSYHTAAIALRPTSSGAALKLGECLLNQGKHDAALKVIQDAVKRDPDYDYGHLCLGLALMNLDRLDDAETQMHEVIRIRPDFPGGYWGLGLVLHRRGKLPEAEELLRTAVKRGPNYYWCHFHLAEFLLETARPEDAEKEFHEAILLNPRNALGYLWLGRALQAQGKLDEAEMRYVEAIRRQSGYPEAHRLLAELRQARGTVSEAESPLHSSLEQMFDEYDAQLQKALSLKIDGKFTEAETFLRNAMKQRPKEASLHFELAQILISLKKPVEAEAAFCEAIRLKPSEGSMHASFAWFLRDQHKLEWAEAEFREAIRLSPPHGAKHYGLATALHRHQKFAAAEEEYNAAIRLQPDSLPARIGLGQLYLDQQRWSEAETTIRTALALDPVEPSNRKLCAKAHSLLGTVLSKQNRPSEAEDAFREAIRIDPESADAHDALAWWLVTQSEFAAAEEQFHEVIRLNPQRPTAYQGLGKSLVKQARYKEAETYLLEALRLQPDNKYVPPLLKQAREGQRRSAEATPELSTENRP